MKPMNDNDTQPPTANQKPAAALDDATCSGSSIPVHEREWFRRIKNYHYTLYVNDPPQLEWDGEKWIAKTNAPTTRATD